MAAFPTPHTARLRERVERDRAVWIEGEPGDAGEPVDGPQFPCLLFLPLGSEDSSQPRSRKITRPTVMWDPADVAGDAPRASGELLILAAELAPVMGAPAVLWQIDGEPQPFGPPGETLVGMQANLKRVDQ